MSFPHLLYLGCLAAIGIINLLPLIGILGGPRLGAAYGIEIDSAEVEILLRHRALLFGLIGGFVLGSLWLPQYRSAALLIAGISMAGFLALAWLIGDYGRELTAIVAADTVGLVLLAVAVVLSASLPKT